MNAPQNPNANAVFSAVAAQGAELEPLYFGPSRSLFGCLHFPRGTTQRGCGVVICPAVGPEYIRCHRSLRVLAAMFARAGYPVLRFDHFATGDSLGEGEEATLARWMDDIVDAVRFMRGRYRVTRLTLLGVRMGATLAVLHMLKRGGVERLVLWDPVVNGQRFVDEMHRRTAQHEKWLVERHGPRPALAPADGPQDLFGFRYSDSLIKDIAAIDLLALDAKASARAFILDNCDDEQAVSLAVHLRAIGLEIELERLQAPKVWMAEPFQGLVSAQSLKRIEAWIKGGVNEQLP